MFFTFFWLYAPSAVVRTLDLEEGTECVLVGTLNKDMKLKPSILEEYTKEVRGGVRVRDLVSGLRQRRVV